MNNIAKLQEQLARKTQECESLKEEIEVLKDNFDTATRDCNELIEELKQECEELREKLKREIKNTVDMERLARSYGQDMLTYRQEKQIEIEELQTNIDRYRKALEEIEEYIKKYECDNCEDYVFGCGDCGTPRDILDILNKAKGEGNGN